MKHFIRFAFLVAAVPAFAHVGMAQDSVALKELNSNFSKGSELRKQNKHVESIPFFQKAAELAPKVFGAQHLNTADINRTAGAANFNAQRYAAAEKHYRICLEIREAKLPKDDVRLAAVLNDLGITLKALARLDDSEQYLTRALAIYEAKFPKDHIQAVATIINLGNVYHDTGRQREAANFFERSLRILEKDRGKDAVETTEQMQNLAQAYRSLGRIREAQALCRRALSIREGKSQKDDIHVARICNALGMIEHDLGQYKEAERHLIRGLEIREKAYGRESLPVADSLECTAIVFGHTGRLDEADIYLRRALAIYERHFGPDHPSVANTLNTMGVFANGLGRRAEALKLYNRALAILEAKLGMNHPRLNNTLTSLAAADLSVGNYRGAEAYCVRTLKILEQSLGADHPDNLVPLNNLAIAYLHTNRPEQARAIHLRVLAIREKIYGKDHPRNAVSYYNLATVYLRTREYDKAEEYYLKALKITEETYGKNHGELLSVLPGLTDFYEATNRMDEARKTLDRCLTIYHSRLNFMFGFSSEAALFDYLESNSPTVLTLVSLALQEQTDAKMAEESLKWVLRLRSTVFDSICQYRQAQMMLQDDELEKKVTRHRIVKSALASAVLNTPQGVSAEKHKQDLADMETEISDLERDIRRTLTRKAPNVFAARENITVDDVRGKLPADGALVELAPMPVRLFKKGHWSKTYHYVAIVLTRTGPPKHIDLGPIKDLDNGVEDLRKEFIDFQEKLRDCETPEEMKTLEQKQEKQFAKKSAALHAKLFAPLQPHLGKATQLYLVCDGLLTRLPFESLVDADGKYLIESYRCVYLSSGRDLLRPSATKAKGTVVFAGPDYKLDADERLAQVEEILKKKNTAVASRSMPANQLRSAGWKNLPGAAAEAKDIQKIIDKGSYGPVTAYVGPRALEEVLKAMPAPRVLHLATHGFFLDREPDSEPPPDDGAGAGWARGRLKRAGNPLLRSGIVLAGANTVGDKDATARVDDGWVTAEEIALLNLQGTELVVLSACQTGLGDIKSGEGVYGLRRAFLYAGARSLVTSLFEVPDTETRELMRRFYTGLDAGQGKLRALHSAQRSFIDDRRKTQEAAHPFFWSSFILVGDAD